VEVGMAEPENEKLHRTNRHAVPPFGSVGRPGLRRWSSSI